MSVDVAGTEENEPLITAVRERFGDIGLSVANAGVARAAGLDADASSWRHTLDVNTLAHVYAAQALIPRWVESGSRHFFSVASAAGLLTQLVSATYSVSKHAAAAFAEWLAITFADHGVRVSCVCPMGVDTPLLHAIGDSAAADAAMSARAVRSAGAVLTPNEVASAIVEGIDNEQFLILPHPEVLTMFRRKSEDYADWLRGMGRFQRSLVSATEG